MKLVFLGPPGAGKGTQAERICEDMGLVHISTGDMLRHEIEAGSEVGLIAADLINRGELVPDEVVIKLVRERLLCDDAKKGVVFDGFPRTLEQARLLTKEIGTDLVLNIDVPLEKLLHRIVTRRTCQGCDIVYSTEELSSENCPECGRKLEIRADDNPEAFKERYQVYIERTLPIIDYYTARGELINIDGDRPKDVIAADIADRLRKLRRGVAYDKS